jgi:eukaryotic-like serine/threonine-protein kinase
MRCPQCGAETLAARETCVSCGAILAQRPAVATGVLTPPPAVDDAGETSLAMDPSKYFGEPDSQTRLAPSPGAAGDETRLGPLDGETILPPTPASHLRARVPRQSSSAAGHMPAGDYGVRNPSDNEGPLSVGQSFGPRYHIIRLLGAGGMGAVYQAWDAELGVAVAIKVIRPEITRDPTLSAEVERRFKRELLLARQVTHQNVVRIHDLGQIDGIKYITMPYIPGNDLGSVLKDEKKLTIGELLRMARSIVSGLVAAHAAGVVHRDLKPANIMIDSEGNALIMDFGIARSTGGPGPSATPTNIAKLPTNLRLSAMQEATTLGSVVGTIEYMAPEQAKGQVVDQRADIYSLGLILYDALMGRRRAENAPSQIDELKGRLQHAPPTVKSVMHDVPAPVDTIIARCIEPDPAKRFQTTVELKEALDRLDDNGEVIPEKRVVGLKVFASVVALAVVLIAGAWYLYFSRPPAALVQRAALPVLIANFDNRAQEPLFDKTLEQALAIGVEGASFLTVYPTRDAERIAARIKQGSVLDETNARLVAVREGIKIVLAGSVERKGDGYALEVKALQPDGKVVATASATASSKEDVLKVMGTLAARIRRSLGDTAPPKAGEMDSFTTTSLEAASLFSQARVHSANFRDEEAIKYYRAATEKDPKFGRAYAGWANGAYRLGRIEESRDTWKTALSLVDRMTDREKYRTLGLYYGTVSQNYDQAIENYKALVKNYPADAAGHNNLALAYFNTLQFGAALEEEKRALEITPTNNLYKGNSALFAMYGSDFSTASAQARQLTEQNPGYYPAYLPLAIAAIAQGNGTDATEAYRKMTATGAAGSSVSSLGLADLAIYQGRFADAATIAQSGITADEQRKNTAGTIAKYSALADAYAGTGQAKRAEDAALKAMALAGHETSAALAALTLARTGNQRDVAALAAALGGQVAASQSRAYGKILEGEIALHQRKMIEALEAFRAAQKLADLWLVHYDLGVTYVQAGQYPEALAELEMCQKRMGEAAAILLDDLPTFRYTATLPYWLGRAKEELGMKANAVDLYKAFLALRPNSPNDALVADARKRVGAAH